MIKLLVRNSDRDAAARDFARLAEILGGAVAKVTLPDGQAVADVFLAELTSARALVSDAATLQALLEKGSLSAAGFSALGSRLRAILIHGVGHCSPESLRRLFGSESVAAGPSSSKPQRCRYHLPQTGSAISRQFAGLSFDALDAKGACGFSSGDADSATRIIDRDAMPFFISTRRGGCEVFLLASSELLDVNERPGCDELSPEAYPKLLPWLFFIRRALGNECWHNPEPKACLIIDDPWLRPHYGFLSFQALIESMRRGGFATSIAFIPWNYTKTAASTAELLKSNAHARSVCVHGCDHIAAAFSSQSVDQLRRKARIAFERMKLRQHATGVGWDPVMVFPQGYLSSAGLIALQREGCLAAVNSGLSSTDRAQEVRVADTLQMAFNRYGGIPLFNRRYPGNILPLALDLFMGKQVLVAEHHTYFRAGCE